MKREDKYHVSGYRHKETASGVRSHLQNPDDSLCLFLVLQLSVYELGKGNIKYFSLPFLTIHVAYIIHIKLGFLHSVEA